MTVVDRKREPIWPFMIPATLIASLWAALVVFGSFDALREEERSTAYMAGYFMGAAVAPSVIVWLVFYLLFFRPRASIGKALGALAVMCSLTLGLQFAPLAVAAAVRGDEDAAQRYTQQSVARVTALTDRVTSDVGALNLPADEAAGIESKAHVAAWLGRLRQAATILEDYDAALNREASATYAAFAGLDLSERRRAEYLAEMEAAIGPDGLTRRVNTARTRELRKEADLLAVLVDNPDAWTIENGMPAFYDSALLARYQALGGDLQTLRRERLQLEAQAVSAQQDHRRQAQERQEADHVGDEGDEDGR